MQQRMRKNASNPPKRTDSKTRGERFTVSVHPLFVLFGIFFGLRGQLALFFVYTVVAVIHECGHASYAAKIGCRLNRLRLLPCGALVSGDIEGIPLSDEIRLALAGPLVNLYCGGAFVALWWLFPELYPYTEAAATASFFLFAVNLLPSYPLDGGRVLYCILCRRRGVSAARKVMRIVGTAVAAVLLALFVASCFYTVNFSILFFALFVLAGTFGAEDERYTRFTSDGLEQLARGARVVRVAVLSSCTVRRALTFYERGTLLELAVYSPEGSLLGTMSQAEFFQFAKERGLYAKLGDFFLGFAVKNDDF